MKNCLRCNLVDNLVESPVDIYITSNVTHIFLKVENILNRENLSFVLQTDIITIPSANIRDIVKILVKDKDITELEKNEILILPLPPGMQFTPKMAFSLKNLRSWEEIISADDLLYIIANRKLVTFFHPIIDFKNKTIHAFECLTRGIDKNGQVIPPGRLFGQAKDLYLQFNLDRIARETSIENAAKNNIDKKRIFINFIPNSIYDPKECLSSTFSCAKKYNFNSENIVFEVIESDKVTDVKHLKVILDIYKEMGFGTALDDLGSGYASLKMLVDLVPDYIKIDMHFIRNIHLDHLRQSLIKAMVQVSKEHNIKVIAEGIETINEFNTLAELGVDYVQGFYFGQPNEFPAKNISNI